MKLNTVELDKLIPSFMREDKNFKAICYALEEEIKLLYEQTNLIKLYQNIDNLPEEILDELAWQFNAIEYSKTYSIDVKRNLIKNCLSTHHKRGTVAAVEEVASRIFGNATVTEWFEYGGEPYHFKVHTANVSTSDEMIIEFNRVIKQTQNIRSHLEEVIAETIDSMDIFCGGIVSVNEDIRLLTSNLGEYETSAIELCVVDGKLSYNLIVTQEQNLTFKDISTGESYMIIYDSASKGLLVDKADNDNTIDYLELTDSNSHKNYKVFIDNGQLFYEKQSSNIYDFNESNMYCHNGQGGDFQADYTVNDNGTITVDGTVTIYTQPMICIDLIGLKHETTYTFSLRDDNGVPLRISVMAYDTNGIPYTDLVHSDNGQYTFTASNKYTKYEMNYYLSNGEEESTTYDNATFYPQLEFGNEMHDWEPYNN